LNGSSSNYAVHVLKGESFNADSNAYFTNAIAVAVGTTHTLAIRDDGTVWGFGSNGSGELGNSYNASASTPIQIGDAQAKHLIAKDEIIGSTTYSRLSYLTMKNSQTLTIDLKTLIEEIVIGFNVFNELTDSGNEYQIDEADYPDVEVVSSDTTIATVSSRDDEGKRRYVDINAAGSDIYGVVTLTLTNPHNGNVGTITLSITKTDTNSYTSVSSKLAAGQYFSMALKADGTVWAWGNGESGQLGDGYTVTRGYPVQMMSVLAESEENDGMSYVTDVNGIKLTYLKAKDIAAGNSHAVVLGANGYVYTTGNNTSYQLGHDDTSHYLRRVIKADGEELGEVKAVAAGANFSMALTVSGNVYAWGDNSKGQLGNNTTTNSNRAVEVLRSKLK
jgi:alpha-tubulin suppressor-like RCC1 family protein